MSVKLRYIDLTTRTHTLTLDRFALVEVKRGRDGAGVEGVVRLGVLTPAPPHGARDRLPVAQAIEIAKDAARRGSLAEVLVSDPNGLWPTA